MGAVRFRKCTHTTAEGVAGPKGPNSFTPLREFHDDHAFHNRALSHHLCSLRLMILESHNKLKIRLRELSYRVVLVVHWCIKRHWDHDYAQRYLIRPVRCSHFRAKGAVVDFFGLSVADIHAELTRRFCARLVARFTLLAKSNRPTTPFRLV